MHVFLVRMICNFTIGCAHEIRIGSTLGRSGTNSFAIVQTIKLKKNDCVYIQKSNLLVINVSSRLYSTPSIALNRTTFPRIVSVACLIDVTHFWDMCGTWFIKGCVVCVLYTCTDFGVWDHLLAANMPRRSSLQRFFVLKEKYRSACIEYPFVSFLKLSRHYSTI